jgi:glycine/D-amino acid oxidase-like deaminating enzyme
MSDRNNNRGLCADLVIIGGGGAGPAAAVAAAERGADVIVLEKRNCTGGNTAMASNIFAAESLVQRRAMVTDMLRRSCDSLGVKIFTRTVVQKILTGHGGAITGVVASE